MTLHRLARTAHALVAEGRGLLAMDESTATVNSRFESIGAPLTEAAHRAWRDLIIGAPGLSDYISGAILFDETFHQTTLAGVPFPEAMIQAGLIVGVKVDTGARPLAGHPGESVTEGLDRLAERLAEYARGGARFAKWRAVFVIGGDLPTAAAIEADAHALARYAALCQAAGLVPIVEPEVLSDGDHSLERCGEITETVLAAVFEQLRHQGVALEAVILKPNMVLPGAARHEPISAEEVAKATLRALSHCAPAAIAGVAFLSGGQSGPDADARLNAINLMARAPGAKAPWPLVCSFGRAIQHPALDIWRGEASRVDAARTALLHRARCAWLAIQGRYDDAAERAA